MRFGAILVLCFAAAWPRPARGDHASDREVVILARVLSYDRNLKTRAAGSLTIAVLSSTEARDRAEGAQSLRVFRELEKLRISGLPIKVIHLEYSTAAALKAAVVEQGIDTFYVSSGLDPVLSDITKVSRAHSVLTIASRPEQVEKGVSVGAFLEGGSYKIYVNLNGSRAENASFPSDLLALAKVVR